MRPIPSQKYWEILPSKNLFFCKGRCISASNISILCINFWLIIITSGLFFAFDCRILIQRSVAILICGIILCISVLSMLFKTAFTDPGIIPRANVSEAEWIEEDMAKAFFSTNSDLSRPQVRMKEVVMKGQTIKLKFCITCKIFRPPRASHCSVCDNCVDRFDHHCPWVGNCIGRRNYRFFFLFNVLLTIYCLYILGFSIANIVLLSIDNKSLTEALKQSPTSIIVIIVSFVSMTSVIGLSGFHSHLICNEISTNEDIKGSYKLLSNSNPHSRGNGCLNCAWIICGPRPPSLLNATQSVDMSNLPVGCSYRGSDGCTVGPVGPSKTIKPYIDGFQTSDGTYTAQPMAGPSEFQNVSYPRQMTYHLTNGDAKVNKGSDFNSPGEGVPLHNYGTISSPTPTTTSNRESS